MRAEKKAPQSYSELVLGPITACRKNPVKKPLAFLTALIFTLMSGVVVSPSELFAAPSVEAPQTSPAGIAPGQPVNLLVTVRILRTSSDPKVHQNGVYLFKTNASGGAAAVLGVMHDDGQNGDAAAGDSIFSLRVSLPAQENGLYLKASAAFERVLRVVYSPVTNVPVSDSNAPPVFTSTPVTTAAQSFEYAYTVTAEDPEGGAVQLSLEDGPDGMTLNGGLLQWFPGENQEGGHPVVIKASDPQGASSLQSFTVQVTKFNIAPSITSVPPRFAKTGETYTYECKAYDPDGDVVGFGFADTPPEGMDLNPQTCRIEWTPSADDAGTKMISIQASDPDGGSDRQTYALEVYPAGVDLSLISPAGTHEIPAGQTLTLPFQANLANAVFSSELLPENASSDQENFVFTPAISQAGEHVVVFKAAAGGQTVSNVVTITVTRDTAENHAPVFDAASAQTIAEGQKLSFFVNAADEDGDVLDYSAPGLSLANAYFNENNREFVFAPSYEQAGNYNVTFSVTDGIDTDQITVPVTVQEAAPPATSLELVVDPAPNPTLRRNISITGNVTGAPAVPAAPELPQVISGLSPSSGKQGETLDVTLTVLNTVLIPNVVTAGFGDGVTVESLEVLNDTTAKAVITIEKGAELGARLIQLVQDGQTIPSIVSFDVLESVASISGRVKDSFTDENLQGVKVGVNGTLSFTTTDSQGMFTLNDVPTGNFTLIAVKPNFTVGRVSVSLGTGEQLTIESPVLLDALARPARLGGSLPPEPTIASVLDRGVSTKGGGMTLDQAKAVIMDTLIAVGGIEAGVFDESGKQLNPKIQGSGEMSLTPQGVEQHARGLLMGDVITLSEFWNMLRGAFSFPASPSLGDLVDGMQLYANEAWANPADPNSGMAFVLFNEGTQLSTEPPQITGSTRFNRFQIYLLLASFIVFNGPSLEDSINAILDAKGIDYESQLPPPAFPDADAPAGPTDQGRSILLAWAKSVDDLLVPEVMAQTPPSNCHDDPELAGDLACQLANLQSKKTFSKVWRSIGANMIAESATAALNAAVITFAQQSAISYMMGSAGGRYGTAIAAMNLAAASVQGALAVLFFKMVLGWAIAAAVASMEPPPPQGEGSFFDEEGNFVIRFAPVPEHVRTAANPPEGQLKKSFVYHLYRVPDCNNPVDAAAAQYVPLKAELDFSDPANQRENNIGTHKFVVPRINLIGQTNHFRVRAFQYIHNKDVDLIEGIAPYDTNNDDGISFGEFVFAGLGGEGTFRSIDADGNSKVDAAEFAEYSLNKIPTGLEITPGVPKTASLRGLMGRPDLLPGSQPGSYQNRLAEAQQIYQQRAEGRVDPFSNGYKARTNIVDFFSDSPFSRGNAEFLPEIEMFVDNRKAFITADDAILQSNISGRQARIDGDETVARNIAADVYQRNLGMSPNPQQVESIQEMVKAQRVKSVVSDQANFIKAAQSNIDKAYTDIETGRVTRGRIHLLVPTFPTSDSMQMVPKEYSFDLTPENKEQVLQQIRRGFAPGTPDTDVFIENWRNAQRVGEANKMAIDSQGPVLKNALQASSGLSADEIETRFNDFLPKRTNQGIVGQAAARMADAQETELRALIKDMKARRVGPLTINEPQIDPRIVGFQKGVGAFTNFAGQTVGASNALLTFLQNVQVLSGEFSEACFEKEAPATPVPTETYPPTFEPYPGADEPSAILRELKTGPKQGYLQREYPGSDEYISAANAGFPPGFISTDRKGSAYALNMASTERFGGRIFRFKVKPAAGDGDAGVPRPFTTERELIGAVNYYSTMIQLARPAFPVAMTVGPTFTADGGIVTQDMFIADTDIVDGKKRILKLYTSLIDINPAAYPESRRNHLVGQPVIVSDELKLIGPSDMEVGPDPANGIAEETKNSVIMFSDENQIFAIVRTPNTETYTLKKVIDISGRRWSGLAFDRLGRMYFADYAGGDIFVIDWETLRNLINDGAIISSEDDLKTKTFRIASGIDRPGDLELEGLSTHPGGVLHVSTFSGILPLTLPIIGKIGNARDIHLKMFGVEQRVSIDAERGVFMVTPSRETIEAMAGTIRYNWTDPETGRTYPSQAIVLIAEHGATIVKEPLA